MYLIMKEIFGIHCILTKLGKVKIEINVAFYKMLFCVPKRQSNLASRGVINLLAELIKDK
jgi:hypothetical protein